MSAAAEVEAASARAQAAWRRRGEQSWLDELDEGLEAEGDRRLTPWRVDGDRVRAYVRSEDGREVEVFAAAIQPAEGACT